MIQPSGAAVGSMSVDLSLNPVNGGNAPLRIILIHDGKTLAEMTMDRPRLMIGRSEDNDLCINDSQVSRHHALLVRIGDDASVTDLNSRHGTYVNFRRIHDEVLIHQDIVSIGNYRLKFIAPDIR
jgi:pSer/pThr/pTyr-binding forkhead associated (FHA) protein